MTSRNSQTFDYALRLKDTGAITASAAAQVGGVAKVLDVGLGARMTGKVVIEISALDFTTTDETYDIALQGSDAAAGTFVELGSIKVTAAQRYELHFVNAIDKTLYQFLRLFTTVGGTTPSINYTAFVAIED